MCDCHVIVIAMTCDRSVTLLLGYWCARMRRMLGCLFTQFLSTLRILTTLQSQGEISLLGEGGRERGKEVASKQGLGGDLVQYSSYMYVVFKCVYMQ